MIGKTIANKYKIYERIGKGTVTEVFVGRDLTTQRMVAIKVIRPHLVDESQVVERFRRESKVLAEFDSPNAVRVYDYGTDGEISYIILELIEGEVLSDIIEAEGRLQVKRALDIARQVAECLGDTDKVGIVHRGIRPANIMVTADGVVKVMDFGVAQVADLSRVTATEVLGSPHYISPELADGKEVDIRSDIYSVGVMLFEMLIGELPYDADNAVDIVLKHLQEPIPSLQEIDEEIPAEVDELVARCLAKDPADRFQTPVDLIEAISEALGEEDRYQRAGEMVEALEEAEEEVEAEQRRRQQEKLALPYAEAVGLLKAKEWQKALDKWTKVQAIDSDYPDPQQVAAKAKIEIEKLAEEERRQEKLAALYTGAVGFLKAKEWQKALDKWAEVQAIDPDYPDPQEVAAKAKKGLAKLEAAALAVGPVTVLKEEEVPSWQRVPVWAWAAIGGVILLAVIGGVFMAGRGEKVKPTPAVARATTPAVTVAPELGSPTAGPELPTTVSPTSTPELATPTPVPLTTPAVTVAPELGSPTASPELPTTVSPTTPPESPTTAVLQGTIAFAKWDPPTDRYQIWTMNADGNSQKMISDLASDPSFSPDGKRIAFYAWEGTEGGNGLWIMNAGGTGREIKRNDANVRFPRWSPRNTYIAFWSPPGAHVHKLIDNSVRVVMDGEHPAWSPDGQRLVMKSCATGGSGCGLYAVGVDGSGKTPLTDSAEDGIPAWSPDGRKIAFICKAMGDTFDICIINADGSGRQNLTGNNAGHDINPAWLLDGSGILFYSVREGKWGIYVMNVDGSGVRKIIDADPGPDWARGQISIIP